MLVQCYREWYVAGIDGRISVEGNLNAIKTHRSYM